MEYNSYHMIKTVIMTCGGMVDGGIHSHMIPYMHSMGNVAVTLRVTTYLHIFNPLLVFLLYNPIS